MGCIEELFCSVASSGGGQWGSPIGGQREGGEWCRLPKEPTQAYVFGLNVIVPLKAAFSPQCSWLGSMIPVLL